MRSLFTTTCIGLAFVAACQRAPDIHEMADGAIESVALNEEVDAVYDESAELVRLTGTVDSDADRTRAEQAVRAAVGDVVQVANEIVIEGLAAEIADDLDSGISARFETLVENTPELERSELEHRVANGVLTVTGRVADEAHKAKVESLARGIPGVTDVVNTVTVDPTLATPRRQ
jgi:hypothetical protein